LETVIIDWLDVLIAMAVVAWAIFGFWAAGHALLYKRDPRSALGWLVVCLLMPYLGPLIYVLFGINRIGQQANKAGRFPASAYSRTPTREPLKPDTYKAGEYFIHISDQIAHLTNDPATPQTSKHRHRDLTHALRRPVESAFLSTQPVTSQSSTGAP
jgi:hypothetical protein